ncbi:unnamed protein product [Trichobilharzia regenti]|nr:unnamed protein product [Trichobilharzia regenti]
MNSLQTSNRSDPVVGSPSTSSHSVSMESMSLAVRSVNFNDSGSNSDATIISDLPSRRCRAGVAVVDGLIYVIGGFNGTLRVRSVEVFDRIRNTWHSGPNMEFRRATLGVAVLNGLIYAVGGFDGIVGKFFFFVKYQLSILFICFRSTKPNLCKSPYCLKRIPILAGLNSAEVLDVWSGSWRSIPSMACQRSSVGVGAVDGKLYAVGGFDGTVRRCLSTVECYDPTTNAWCMVSEMAFR